ncbi:hypothetical protein [Photobacterium leiognathi]|uniref:hypothetical protein n=1 Tax=Photobacterium leiognathi TaxID=553611 RepID=UPI0029824497|nr:hypothetical protein [Photobacterium leiognathi]
MMGNFENAKRELIAVFLPIFVLIIIKIFKGEFAEVFKIPDFSLAISIMYGQLLAKTFEIPDKNKSIEKFNTFQLKIFTFAILSIIMYACFQLIDSPSIFMYIVQIMLLTISIYYYLPFSTLLSDMRKEVD